MSCRGRLTQNGLLINLDHFVGCLRRGMELRKASGEWAGFRNYSGGRDGPI